MTVAMLRTCGRLCVMCARELDNRVLRVLLVVLCVLQRSVLGGALFSEDTSGELNVDLPVMATAFVQTGNELHYFSDVEYHENLIGGAPVKSDVENEPMLNNQLQFSPKELNFGEQSMGVPHQEKVRVHNPTASTVRFDAISGSTVHFHCSFPEHKTVNPGEATTFDVVFLPRQEGHIDNVLFVHSSLGTFTYTVEITRKRGIFATVDLLDFGLMRWGEKSQQLTLEIVSTLEKGIDIESLYVERGEEPNGIYMEFASKPPISIKCGARQQPGAPKAIAKVTFDSKLLKPQAGGAKLMRYKGRIIADSRGGNYNVSVPYVATVYTGSLEQSADETAFHSQLEPPVSHGVSLTNNLPFGVAIWNISLGANARKSFVAKLLSRVVTLGPGESRPVFWLKYAAKEEDDFASHCTLHTNVTTFSVPIVIFNGKLRVTLYSIDQTQFDFGLMDAGDSRSIQFAITNENPVAVKVKQLRNALPSMTSLTLLGIEAGNQIVLASTKERNWSHVWQQGMDFTLPGRSVAVFKYTLTAPADRSVLRDAFVIETDFERMTFPVKYSLDEGTVISVPERLSFPRAFPGKMSSQVLQMYSTFKRDMHVLRMSTLSHDPRIFFESFPADNPPVLKAGQLSNLGRVLYMPGATCIDDCYVGMPLHTADGQWFTYGVKLPQNLAEIDSYLYRRLRRKWLAIKAEKRYLVNATVIVDTEEVKHVAVPVQGQLVWPRLLTRSVVHFPLTAVGNFTIVNLTLTNPSSLPVVVQLLPLVIYPDAESLVEFFRDELEAPLTDPIEMNETLMFSLRDTELFTLKPDSPVPKLREQLERVLGIQIPKFTLSMMLQPGMKVRIRVGFLPSDYILRSSLLLIRNNLTVMEPVVLYGRGAHMDMQVEGRAARTKDPLMFEIQPHHLSDCHNPKRLTHKLFTTLTVKRSFTVLNSGEVPFTVVNMSLNNIPCENRGFKILNCHPFTLAPNQTHIIDIAYTPDFLMSWNEAALQFYMHMNGTSWLFPLGASVPRHLLAKCHAALPRPPFESLMYYSCVSALVFCLVCVVACAYLEGDRTVTCAIRQQYSQSRRVFDLNALDPNGPGRQVIPGTSTAGETKHSPRRHVLHYAEDANIVVRSFWQTANGVLWLFSFIWQLRGDEPSPPAKDGRSRTAKAPVVKSIHVQTTLYDRRGGARTSVTPPPYYSWNAPTTLTKRSIAKNGRAAAVSDSGASLTLQAPVATPKSPKMNGEARSGKSKGPASTGSNSVLPQTKSSEASPLATTANRAFGIGSKSEGGSSTAVAKSGSTRDDKERVRSWTDRKYGAKTLDSAGRRRSESASDATLIGSTSMSGEERLKGSEALMDSGRGRNFGGLGRKGVSRSGDELSTAVRASVHGQQGGNANAMVQSSKRKLSKSHSLQREGTNERTSSMSSDVDSDLMLASDSHVNTARTPSINISDTLINASERTRDWLSPPSERAFDERSEAGFSDASAAPEWADGPPINNLDGNVDDDFSALAAAAEHLFDSSEVNSTPALTLVVPPTVPKSTGQHSQSRRNARKKHGNSNSNKRASAASSRSASCSSLDTNAAAKEATQPAAPHSKSRRRSQQKGGGAGAASARHEDKPDGMRPSAFIQQLQMERKLAEERYLRKKSKANEESREVWPGFNLKLPALAENLWDTDFEVNDPNGPVTVAGAVGDAPFWRPPHVRSTNWPPTPDTPTRDDVAQSVLAFRLNPQAEPFVVGASSNNRSSTQSRATLNEPSPPIGLTQASGLFDGLMDDPLGLSGSLFGRGATNIWASGAPNIATASSTSAVPESGDTNPAAVYWAEKFLADEEDDK
ncbi:Transmembrane protein [Toxocara canis]|uniref:Transmembrane protein n=1 Tax=Toxocara canis TaxID=6265 RepID=A0A0B2VH38_TOXCA|nr:Transmembrane protein [Toxocara canis]